MAERVDSNPRTSCPVAVSRPVLSTAQPPLLKTKLGSLILSKGINNKNKWNNVKLVNTY